MAIRTIIELKSFFETGDVPTQEQFADLIDTVFSMVEVYPGPYKNDSVANSNGVALDKPYTLTADNDYGIPSNDGGTIKIRKT